MDLVQHPDGKTYRRVGSLEGELRERAEALMAKRSRRDRKNLGLPQIEGRDDSLLTCGHIESLATEVVPGVFVCRACRYAEIEATRKAGAL